MAWLIKQKILFFQNLFWISFFGSLILSLSAIGFFIAFLLKENSNFTIVTIGMRQSEWLQMGKRDIYTLIFT